METQYDSDECQIRFSGPLGSDLGGGPFDMSSPKVASEIGSRFGEVVEVERRKNLDA